MITKQLMDLAVKRAAGLTVDSLCLGLGYTGVKLSNGQGGVSYSLRNENGGSCGVLPQAGFVGGTPASDLINLAMNTHASQASLGIATINAVLNQGFEPGINAADAVEVRDSDTIGMVGNFCPLVRRFSQHPGKMYIFEKHSPAEGVLPDWAEEIYLPGCDVVYITGVTFINKTIDRVLELSCGAREIVLLGASVCMAPDLLRERGVTVLAGSQVNDADLMLKVVAQGGGGMDMTRCTTKLCERLSQPRR